MVGEESRKAEKSVDINKQTPQEDKLARLIGRMESK